MIGKPGRRLWVLPKSYREGGFFVVFSRTQRVEEFL